MGAPAADAMRRRFAAIEVAVKNQDNREHDIFDSDDYLQDHGGMIATIRALRGGEEPKAWFGDSADPADPKVRSLAEEAARVVRTRVLNPKWIGAMCRHGYKGAFEMAATVDYLFGYDATAHVVEDWMYERVTEAYVADPDGAQVLRAVEPVGPALDRRAAAGGQGPGPVGRLGRGPGHPAVGAARGRGLGGGPVTVPDGRAARTCGSSPVPVLGRRRPGRRQAGPAAGRRRPGHRRRAAAGPEGVGQDHAGPGPGRPARRRRAVRRAAARRHRGPARRLHRPGRRPDRRRGPVLARACWPPPTAACSTSTRSTCWPTTWSTCCSTWPSAGVNRVEREGISHAHPSRFVLVGSMNPEEGDLRPQLLDRFGLAVDVLAPGRPRPSGPRPSAAAWPSTPTRPAFAGRLARRAAAGQRRRRRVPRRPASTRVSVLCASVGAEGLRADLVICRAAAALAGLEGRAEATVDDVRRVAPLALAHRRRRHPFDDPGMAQDEIDEALDAGRRADRSGAGPGRRQPDDPPDAGQPGWRRPGTVRRPAGGPALGRSRAPRGRLVGDRAPSRPARRRSAVGPHRSGPRRPRRARPTAARSWQPADLREAVRERAGRQPGDPRRRRVRVDGRRDAAWRRPRARCSACCSTPTSAATGSPWSPSGATAPRWCCGPTGSVEVARARLTELPTGGRTPLAAGITTALEPWPSTRPTGPLLVLVSDGRATAGPDGIDPLVAAKEAAAEVRRRGVPAVVVDAEDGHTRLGLAAELAEAMGARYLTLPQLTAATVRQLTGG